MFKLIIHNKLLPDYTAKYSPKNWTDFGFTITRSATYRTCTKSFIDNLVLVKEDKKYVENIFNTQGYYAEILISIYVLNQKEKDYELFYKGKINYKTFKITKSDCSFDLINGGFEDLLFSKEENIIDYRRLTDINGNQISPLYSPENNIYLKQFDHYCVAVKPFYLFQKIIYVITGQKDSLRSLFFDETEPDNLSEGKYAFLTTGKQLNGKVESGGLSTSLKTVFTNLSKIYGLGLCVEHLNYSKKWVRIDKLAVFFSPQIVATLDNLSDLEYSINQDYLTDIVNVGYNVDNEENTIANNEYNTKSIYSLNIGTNDAVLDLVSDFRSDGTGMKLAINEQINDDGTGTYDDKIFVINCVKNENRYESSQTSNMELVDGISGSDQIIMNTEITPANMLKNNYAIASIPSISKIGKYSFTQENQRSKIITKKVGATETLRDCTDLDLSVIGISYLSPFRIKFNCSPDYETFRAISFNPHGLIKIYDYINKKYVYGWINEISSNLVDKTTNVDIQLANRDFYKNFVYLTKNDGRMMQFANGANIKINK